MTGRLPSLIVGVAFGALLVAQPAAAQGSRRLAVDTVIGLQDSFLESRDWPTQGVFDTFVSIEPLGGIRASVRPKVWRSSGDWKLLVDQASIEYAFRAGTQWRIEAGRFPSAIGLGMMENRPDVNAGLIWWHRPYYMPLPSIGASEPRVSLISAVYPTGALVSTSGDHWDARAGLVNRAPVEFWVSDPRAGRGPNIVLGGGVSPRQGLRIGLAGAAGGLRSATPAHPPSRYSVVNVEADYAFAYTRISGEWTRDRFDTPDGARIAQGWTSQVQQTLTPRVFVHARATVIDAPEVLTTGLAVDRRYRSMDTTIGYHLNAELTGRIGYTVVRGFSASSSDHQVGISLMWARRWW